MTETKHYGALRGLFMWACILLIIASFGRFISLFGIGASQTRNSSGTPPNYQRRFCDERKTKDYSNQNPDKITITLQEGCYGDRIIMPRAWSNWEPQLSSNVGDYLSVWCTEEPNPRRLVPYTGDPKGITVNCPANHPITEFSTQGKGTFTLVRTQTDENAVKQIAKEDREASYKLTPVEPRDGQDKDFSIVIEQCYRSEENIECMGFATNKTDAPTTLSLNGGTIVDDEGNSGLIGGIGYAGTAAECCSSNRAHLIPNQSTKFFFASHDPHQKVKSISFEMQVAWYGSPYRSGGVTFTGVPVQ